MEYGTVAKLRQFVDTSSVEVQRVQSSKDSSEIKNKNELKQIQQEVIAEEKKTSDVKEVKNDSSSAPKYEVVLSNTNFGYNDSSKDFFVKVERANVENQYPTQEMMQLKAYMLSIGKEA